MYNGSVGDHMFARYCPSYILFTNCTMFACTVLFMCGFSTSKKGQCRVFFFIGFYNSFSSPFGGPQAWIGPQWRRTKCSSKWSWCHLHWGVQTHVELRLPGSSNLRGVQNLMEFRNLGSSDFWGVQAPVELRILGSSDSHGVQTLGKLRFLGSSNARGVQTLREYKKILFEK